MVMSTQFPSIRRIAIIGGGISGLAAAHRLQELAPQFKLTLIEASPRLGGVLRTEEQGGFLVEGGADNFITTSPGAVEFCRQLGFEDELETTNDAHRRAFVVRKGQLEEIPAGFIIMAPSRIGPIATSRILSLPGKVRLAAEVFVRQRFDAADESLASFVRRRLGREAYERLVQPLVAGIYTADPERLSAAAAMPRFVEMERQHGSLIRAMWHQGQKRQDTDSQSGSGARYSQFVAPRRGMSSFVEAAAKQLSATEILLDSPVVKMQHDDNGTWILKLGGANPRDLSVNGVIVAIPANRGSRLLRDVDVRLADDLAKIEYGSCAVINFGFHRRQIGHALDGFGFVVPRIEGRKILSASFSSVKYPGRAPRGMVLVRVFVGGALQRELLDLTDEPLLELAQNELKDLLDIQGQPIMRHLVRRDHAMPQYHVGHLSLVAGIRAREATIPGLALAGNALEGIGVPNCIDVGQRAGERLVSQFVETSRQNSPAI